MIVLISSFKVRAPRIANETPSHRTRNGYISKSRSSWTDWTAKSQEPSDSKRKPTSTHRSQIPHFQGRQALTQHTPQSGQATQRQQNKLPHLKHQSVPTQKYSLLTHVQGLRKVLHWKHNTIPTRSCERTFDQRQFDEAFYIRKHKPELNSREECSELRDLLF